MGSKRRLRHHYGAWYTGPIWSQEAKLTASDAAVNDQFGVSVSISGDLAIVGALAASTAGSSPGSAYVYDLTFPFPVPFDAFVIERARVVLGPEPDDNDFRVRGSFTLGAGNDGIDVSNEDVTVTFDGFSETIPAGSFFRDDDDRGFQFDGVTGGITRIEIRDNGEFTVKGRGIPELSGINLPGPGPITIPVPFSLQIGDDAGVTGGIRFGALGHFPAK